MPNPPQFVQIGVVVESVDEAIEHYKKLLGLTRWHFKGVDSETEPDTHFERSGRVVPTRAKIAWSRLGDIEIELIQPLDQTSIYAEFLKEKGTGLHHLMIGGADFKALDSRFQGNGVSSIMEGQHLGHQLKLLDTRRTLGFLSEIAEGEEIAADEILDFENETDPQK